MVVDLWAGHADPGRTRPWQKDTIAIMFSSTKALTALCALRLVEQGKLDLDAPVTTYWPEFGQAGKEQVPVRWLLTHQVGLPAIREILPPEALYDWTAMATALAAEKPWWTPGETFGYHPVTFGWLVGEVVRRISGVSLGTFFRREIAEPLGIDAYIGLRPEEIARCADITQLEPPPDMFEETDEAESPLVPPEAYMNPSGTGDMNSEPFRASEIPALNGHANARALARLYGALAAGGTLDGVQVRDRETIDLARTEQVSGIDEVMHLPLRIGLTFWLSQPDKPDLAYGTSAGAFGHAGAGGSVGFADPEGRTAFAYVPNKLGISTTTDPRAQRLIAATYQALGV